MQIILQDFFLNQFFFLTGYEKKDLKNANHPCFLPPQKKSGSMFFAEQKNHHPCFLPPQKKSPSMFFAEASLIFFCKKKKKKTGYEKNCI